MDRRDFITLLIGTMATWPLAARAQQPAMPVIGFLHSSSPDGFSQQVAALHQALKEGSFVEGQNIAIEFRWAEDRYERLPALAAELIGQRVAVIFAAGGNVSAVAAKAATSTIPIVFAAVADPVGGGLVTSLNRPGGNATGMATWRAHLAGEVVLQMRRDVLGHPIDADARCEPGEGAGDEGVRVQVNIFAPRQAGLDLLGLHRQRCKAAAELRARLAQPRSTALVGGQSRQDVAVPPRQRPSMPDSTSAPLVTRLRATGFSRRVDCDIAYCALGHTENALLYFHKNHRCEV